MKVRIIEDERYPFFIIRRGPASRDYTIYDVPRRKVNYWKRVMKEFEKVQEEMEEYREKGASK